MEDSLGKLNTVEHIFLTEIFEKMCPYYMAIGMSYDQYWRDDVTMPIMFRKAHNIKQEQMKWLVWEGGVYTYEALCKVSPVLHAFAKNGTKPLPFSSEPYGINKIKEQREKEENEKDKKKQETTVKNERLKAQIFFNNWYRETKKHFENKQKR